MSDTQKPTVRMRFDVGAMRFIGFSVGKDEFMSESASMSFSIKPASTFDSPQTIWITSEKEKDHAGGAEQKSERDGRWRWQLTEKTPGTLYISKIIGPINDSHHKNFLSWQRESIGSNYYIEESFSISLYLHGDVFNEFREMVILGKPPRNLEIFAHDIIYGNAPDGSDKEWKVDAHSLVIVSAFSIGLSVELLRVNIGPPVSEYDAESAREREEEERQASLQSRDDTYKALAAVYAVLVNVKSSLTILCIISIASLALAVLAYHHQYGFD